MNIKLKRALLIVIASLYSINPRAQVNCLNPYTDEYKSYFKNRNEEIRKIILDGIYKGKIQPYGEYGFTYPIDLNANNFKYWTNDTVKTIAGEDIGGLNFLVNIHTKNAKLLGIELLTYFQFDNNKDGICWVKAEDLKGILNAHDFHFLELLAIYAPYSNTHSTNAWYKPPFSGLDTDGRMVVKLSSEFFNDMSSSLSMSNCYLTHISTVIAPKSDKPYEVEVVNKKVNMNITQLGKYFNETIVIYVNTDPDDPTIGYDSTLTRGVTLNSIGQINVDTMTGTINYFTVTYFYDYPDSKSNTFKFTKAIFDEFEPSQRFLWFLEDYFRYCIARKELPVIKK